MMLHVLFVVESFTQIVPPSRQPRTTNPNRPDPATERWYEELRRRENAPTGIGQVETRLARISALKDEARKKIAATREEKQEFGEFLKAKGTGLVRLAALTDCTRILDVTKPDSNCLNYYLPGNAQAYSFRKHDYTHPAFADIERSKDGFVLGGTFVLGLITTLGDIPLESVTSSNEYVSALSAFIPAIEMSKAAQQENYVKHGIPIGTLTYRKQAPVIETNTYLLRSVAYRVRSADGSNEKQLNALNDDDRQDIIVAFRVVRHGPDDTLLLLWKKIVEKESPELQIDLPTIFQKK